MSAHPPNRFIHILTIVTRAEGELPLVITLRPGASKRFPSHLTFPCVQTNEKFNGVDRALCALSHRKLSSTFGLDALKDFRWRFFDSPSSESRFPSVLYEDVDEFEAEDHIVPVFTESTGDVESILKQFPGCFSGGVQLCNAFTVDELQARVLHFPEPLARAINSLTVDGTGNVFMKFRFRGESPLSPALIGAQINRESFLSYVERSTMERLMQS